MDLRTAQRELTANALTTDQPSAFSAQQLLSLNLYELFDVNPEKALAQLYAGLFPAGDEDVCSRSPSCPSYTLENRRSFLLHGQRSVCCRVSFQDLTVLRRKASILGCVGPLTL